MITTTNPSKKEQELLENVSIYVRSLLYGKENGKIGDELYKRYRESGGKLEHDTFRRKPRYFNQAGKKMGYKICSDDSGNYIAKNDKEWIEFKELESKKVRTKIRTFAECEGKSYISVAIEMIFPINSFEVKTIIKQLVSIFRKKDKTDNLNLFNEAAQESNYVRIYLLAQKNK